MAGQRVHDGLVERVPHVQDAGHVRRRQLDAERRTAGREASTEIAARLHTRIPGALDGRRLEALGNTAMRSASLDVICATAVPLSVCGSASRASSARTAWSTLSRNEAATASRVSATSSSISRSIAPPIRLRTIVSICWGQRVRDRLQDRRAQLQFDPRPVLRGGTFDRRGSPGRGRKSPEPARVGRGGSRSLGRVGPRREQEPETERVGPGPELPPSPAPALPWAESSTAARCPVAAARRPVAPSAPGAAWCQTPAEAASVAR